MIQGHGNGSLPHLRLSHVVYLRIFGVFKAVMDRSGRFKGSRSMDLGQSHVSLACAHAHSQRYQRNNGGKVDVSNASRSQRWIFSNKHVL